MKPEDVSAGSWAVAYKIAEADCGCAPGRRRANGTSHSDGCWKHVEAIARAIMAAKAEEREACAAHLESEAKASPLGHESIQRGRSTYNWLAYCAGLIRKRGEG